MGASFPRTPVMLHLPDAFNPRRRLRARLALAAAGVVLLLSTLLALAVDHILRDEQRAAVVRFTQLTARQMAAAVSLSLRESVLAVRQVAAQPGLGGRPVDPGALRAGLERIRAAHGGMAWLGVADAEGRVVAGTGRWLEGEQVGDRAWFDRGRQAPWLGPVEDAQMGPLPLDVDAAPWRPGYLAVSAPFHDDFGRFEGVVTALLEWRGIEEGLADLLTAPARERGLDVLLRAAGSRILVAPAALRAQSVSLGAAEAALAAGRPQLVAWPDGQTYLVAAAPVSLGPDLHPLGWQVLLRQPMAQVLALLTRPRLLMAGAVVVLTLLSIGLVFWMAGRLTAPLQRLARTAEDLRQGGHQAFAAEVGRDDEIGHLGRTLHELQAELDRRVQQLQQSVERYANLFEHAPDAIFVHRNDRVAEVNRAAIELYGAPDAAALVGRDPYELLDPSAREAVRARIEVLRREGGALPVTELRIRRLDGSLRWVDATASTFMDGDVLCLHSVLRDITQRKAQGRRLAQQQALLVQTSRMGRVGGWHHDFRTGESSWSDEISRIFELPEDTPRTLDVGLSVFEGAWREQVRLAFARLVKEALPYDLELVAVTRRGEHKWVRASAQPVLREGRVVAVDGLTQDITEGKESELALRALQADLERLVQTRTAALSAANAELDSFAYAVSHDLRAPLRAMSGFAEALAEDHGADLPAQARGYLEQITRASRRMGELIDALLALSRVTRGVQREDEVDVSALAGQARAELMAQSPQRRVEWSIEPDLRVRGDRRMIDVLVANLVGNAFKYTARQDPARIGVAAVPRDGHTWIEVSDNGAGFDAAHAARLFQPFQRLHRQDEFPGLGIGLATAWRIVQRHGGRIEAEGQVGVGAVFRFCLDRPVTHDKDQGVS